MKRFHIYRLFSIAAAFLIFSAGCDEYLDQTPESLVSDEDIFTTYRGMQGFVDKNYFNIQHMVSYGLRTFPALADDGLVSSTAATTRRGENGNYFSLINGAPFSVSQGDNPLGVSAQGIWPQSWAGIRLANLALSRIDEMVDATQEERNLIEGQCYFFRAYLHWCLIKYWGGMPYVDQYLGATDDLNLPRLTYQETSERIVEDLDKAASLLPIDWDETNLGKKNPGANLGRITKGSAIGLKAKVLLFAGSPTMVHASTGGGYVFDAGYMERAASAAYELIQLANAGYYGLAEWEDYYKQFARNDGFLPWSKKETLIARINDARGWINGNTVPGGRHEGGDRPDFNGYTWDFFVQSVIRNFGIARFQGSDRGVNPTQNLVDLFEMKDTGLPIGDPESGYVETDPYGGRDPRLHGGIATDRDEFTINQPFARRMQFFKDGEDDKPTARSPYMCIKYWPFGSNNFDRVGDAFIRISAPELRMAEIYLIYAEAVNELSGPNGTAAGASLTAGEAVNIVRNRAQMPNVHAKYMTSKESFRDRIWNERAVELFYEDNSRFMDLRRWHVAHLDKYKMIYRADFDENYTYFDRKLVTTKVFDERNYWLPIYKDQSQIFESFNQNPGW